MIKQCIDCKIEKTISEFYKHPNMKDGTANVCKLCHKTRMILRNKTPAAQEYDRQRAKTPKRKEHAKRVHTRWLKENPEKVNIDRKRNPEKYKARTAVGNAVRDGRLIKGTCVVCGSSKVTAHHSDYNEPLDVTWLCYQHHSDLHQKWHKPYIIEVL